MVAWSVDTMKGAVSLLYEFCEHYLRADLEFVSRETGLYNAKYNLYQSLTGTLFTCRNCKCMYMYTSTKQLIVNVFMCSCKHNTSCTVIGYCL